MADPTYRQVVTEDALTSPILVQAIDGINRCLPDLPKRVRFERIVMARNLLMHTCAEHEGELAEHGPRSRSVWPVAGEGLIDAIVGLWCAPVHVNIATADASRRRAMTALTDPDAPTSPSFRCRGRSGVRSHRPQECWSSTPKGS